MAVPGSFMETPLAVWVQTFSPDPVSYQELSDGVFLNEVMCQIDSKAITEGINDHVEDARDRVQNWDVLLKNIKIYYKDVLQQFIVMKLPNIHVISKETKSEEAKKEITKVLLLILGCAVQSEYKEQFIENIKQLQLEVQHAIVEFIKEITDDTKNVFAVEVPLDQMDEVSKSMYTHLRGLVDERDGYIEEIKELNQTLQELYEAQQELKAEKGTSLQPPAPVTSSSSPDKHHITVELADCKAKLRKIRQELEEKTEYGIELQEELHDLKATSGKLRSENLELTQDARAARTYRDELDILKEKASRVDKYEAEITKYKEKLNELEFFKARLEEIREDNAILVETKNMLEDQLGSCHKRVEAVIEIENDLMSYKQQLEAVNVERDIDRKKLQELAEENARLEFQQKSSFNESANLEEELQRAREFKNAGLSNSLSDQLSETANAKILRLELENQRLQKNLEGMKENSMLENATRVLELEKENSRLAKKVDKLQDNTTKETQQFMELENSNHDMKRQTKELEHAIETIKENSDRQVHELERENDQLSDMIEVLRERSEKTNDLRVKDLEKDNKRLHDNVKHYTAQVSNLEFEYRQLQKQHERLQDNAHRVDVLEEAAQEVEHEREDLRKTVTTLQLTCDKYERLEQDASDLEVENKKLHKVVESLHKSADKVETLEQQNINLTVESQHLKRTIENLKSSSSKYVELDHEKSELSREILQLKKVIQNSKGDAHKVDQLEVNMLELDTENQRLQRHLEAVNRKVEALDHENQELDLQNEKLQKSLETMKLSVRKLEEVERENKDIDVELSTVQREKASAEKENKKLKQLMEMRDASLDDMSSKVSVLERENKSLKKVADRAKDTTSRVRELEKENKDVVQQCTMDKKTLSTLREDLVNEKIRSQQLNNELAKLTQELERVGLNREKLVAASQSEDESKYKALESMMEDAFKRSVDIKEEKIHALESRLSESKSRNFSIQDELKSVKRQFEALQQRREEEVMQMSSTPTRERPQAPPQPAVNATKEILELNNQLITVERKNATLEADNKNLREHTSSIKHRLHETESQKSNLQHRLSSIQGQCDTVQTQYAKIQVEMSTLHSQLTSLTAQNSGLLKTNGMLESRQEELLTEKEELHSQHEQLSQDHDQLVHIHDQLTAQYDTLISEHGALKASHKALKADFKEMQNQNSKLIREQEIVGQLKLTIDREKEGIKSDSRTVSQMQVQLSQNSEEKMRLQNANENVTREYRDLQNEHKRIKTEYNQLKLKHTELQGNYSGCKNQLSTMDMEITRLVSKCENLGQLNTKLEEDNSALMMQLQALLTQNQELLTVSLESKDLLAEEQRAYLERVSDLNRQKERLEEKIMDQYKRYDPVKKKNRGFGANLVRKAKQMVKGNRSRSRERSKAMSMGELSYIPDSPENSSLGSGSVGSMESPDVSTWKKTKKNYRQRRGSQSDLLEESPKLSMQNKGLAKSTTALNMLQGEQKYSRGGFALRGARSSENLLGDTPRSNHSAEMDSLHSTNASNNSEWPERSGRRRTLLDTSHQSNNLTVGYNGRGSSLSSEDNVSRNAHSRESSIDKRNETNQGKADDDSEDEEDGLISLDQFLSEVDRSPKARRKYVKEHKKRPKSSFTEASLKEDEVLETTVLSPDLGPRAPTGRDNDEKKLSKTGRMCKSEMNISQLSKISGSSTFHSFDDPKRDLRNEFYPHTPPANRPPPPESNSNTSTPRHPAYNNQDTTAFSVKSFRERQRASSVTDHHLPLKARENLGQFTPRPNGLETNASGSRYSGSGSSGTSTPDHHASAFHAPQYKSHATAPQRPAYTSPPSGMSQHNNNNSGGPHRDMSRQSSGSSIGSYNATTRQTSATGPVPHIPTPTRYVDSHTTASIPPRQAPVASIPRAKSVGPEMMMRSAFSPPERYDASNNNNKSPQRQLPITPESGPPRLDTTNHYHSNQTSPGLTDNSQYNPGNVRNLVQTYQRSTSQSNTPVIEKVVPVPPPRRTRPVSAGPLHHGNESAFSVPQRPVTPSYPDHRSTTTGLTIQLQVRPESAGARRLPQTPAELRAQQQQPPPPPPNRSGAPGQTPPRPQSASRIGPDGEPLPKSSIWYEYGCV